MAKHAAHLYPRPSDPGADGRGLDAVTGDHESGAKLGELLRLLECVDDPVEPLRVADVPHGKQAGGVSTSRRSAPAYNGRVAGL